MSTYTEEEAKKKWCPYARVLGTIDQGVSQIAAFSFNRHKEGEPFGQCIGSACMAFRWKARFGTDPNNPENCAALTPTHGYCGLAGTPT